MVEPLETLIGLILSPVAIVAAGAAVIAILFIVVIAAIFDMVDRG